MMALSTLGCSRDLASVSKLALVVQDDGPAARGSGAGHDKPPDDPERDPDLDLDLASPWPYVNGHGLWVARKVADRMHVRSGPDGTRATVMFTLAAGC